MQTPKVINRPKICSSVTKIVQTYPKLQNWQTFEKKQFKHKILDLMLTHNVVLYNPILKHAEFDYETCRHLK